MDDKNRFKLALLTSCIVHFSLILLLPTLKAPLKPLPKYVEVSLVKVRPKPVARRVVRVTTTKKKAKVEEKKVAKVEEKKKIAKVVKVEKKTVGKKVTGPIEKGGGPSVGGKVTAAAPKEIRLAAKVSPVKISAQPGPKLPTLPPEVRTESEIKVPLIGRSVEPTLGTGISEYALQGERAIIPEGRPLPGGEKGIGGKGIGGKELLPQGSGLPSKIPSSIGGGVSYQPGEGEGVGGGRGRGIRGPLGKGGREIERQVEPPYPEWAQRQGKKGVVEVKCWVLPSGEVRNVEVYRSSGLPRLDEHASQYLMMWKFERIKEKKIQWGIVPFHFKL